MSAPVKQVTVYDIAKEANVSVSTVSRVLNDTAPVKKSTKEKVNQLIEKYQFHPNALARSLTKKTSGMIGIILPDITNPFFPEVFSGAEKTARDKGYTLFLCDTEGDYERETQYLNALREKQVDGIIFLGGRINLAKCDPKLTAEVVEVNRRIPVVLVNGDLPGRLLHRVYTDEVEGARLAIQHLIDYGHRHIAFIGGMKETTTTTQKVKMFRQVMLQNGLEVPKEWVLEGSFSIQSGQALMRQLFSEDHKPTAVFCVNDFTAIGAYKAASQLGMRIPDDISIVGFDDTPLASSIIPELTTISQKSTELGRLAVEMLHQLILKEDIKRVTVLQPELIVRESTKRYLSSANHS
jgi:LacI family transcriptional regulator